MNTQDHVPESGLARLVNLFCSALTNRNHFAAVKQAEEQEAALVAVMRDQCAIDIQKLREAHRFGGDRTASTYRNFLRQLRQVASRGGADLEDISSMFENSPALMHRFLRRSGHLGYALLISRVASGAAVVTAFDILMAAGVITGGYEDASQD